MDIRPFDFAQRFDIEAPAFSIDALHARIAELEEALDDLRATQQAEWSERVEAALEHGRAEGRAEVDAALRAALDLLHGQLERIERQLDERVTALARDGAALAFAAAEVLAGQRVGERPSGAVEAALGRVLRDTERATALTVTVHPTLAPALETWLAAQPEPLLRSLRVEVVADDATARGDGVVSWHRGGLAVDAAARRDALIAELDLLLAAVTAPPPAGESATESDSKEVDRAEATTD